MVSYPVLETSPPHVIVSVLPNENDTWGKERTARHAASFEKSEIAIMPEAEAEQLTAGS